MYVQTGFFMSASMSSFNMLYSNNMQLVTSKRRKTPKSLFTTIYKPGDEFKKRTKEGESIHIHTYIYLNKGKTL